MPDRVLDELRVELEAATPDVWPRVLRSIDARRIATELLAALAHRPSPQTRLGWELRQRVHRSVRPREVA